MSTNKMAAEEQKIMYLNYENLKELPEEITQKTNICGLFLKRNFLQTLPPSISKMENIVELNLDSNQINTLPDEIKYLKNLVSLDLKQNKLTRIPEGIFELPILEKLNLYNNEVAHIGKGIWKLKSLKGLYLSSNQLKYLPVQLFECQNIVNLHLDNNQLKFLPKELVKLKELADLSLSENGLLFLNPNIWIMANLKTVDYWDNPLLWHSEPPLWTGNERTLAKFQTNAPIQDTSSDENRTLLILKKFKEFYNIQLVCGSGIPTLFELTVCKVYTNLFFPHTEKCRERILRQLPKCLRSCFETPPPCFCFTCKKPLFTWAIVDYVADWKNIVVFCCSNKCLLVFRKICDT